MTNEAGEVSASDTAPVEIRGNAAMFALVTVVATASASAYAYRAVHGGGWLHWLVTVALGAIAVVHAAGWWDTRAPRLVADDQGVRLRRGRHWTGTTWDEVETVEVGRAGGLLRDGQLRIRTGGKVLAMRYGVSARASRSDLPRSLRTLGAPVAPPPPGTPRHAAQATPPQEPALSPAAPRLVSTPAASVTADAGRRAVRADVRRDGPASVGTLALQQPEPALLPEVKELRGTSGRVGLVLETVVASATSTAVPDTAVDAAPVEPYPTEPAAQPVIGPELAAARARLRLNVDEVAERTRIRPHVIESIEVDDFVPCGGDFYARGHIRALARVLGVDPRPLVASYDERYASAPIDARRVFAAELASGPAPALRMTRGGPNWAALLGMVMVLAILWAVVRLLDPGAVDAPAPLPQPGAAASSAPAAPDPTRFAGMGAPTVNRVRLMARGGSSVVTVRDDAGEVVWRGALDDGETHAVRVSGSATVVASDAGVVAVSVNGKPRGRLGEAGVSVQRVFGGR